MGIKDTIIRCGESNETAHRQRALDLIVDNFFSRPRGLAAIVYDADFSSPPYDIETGFAGFRRPQTVKAGPRFFNQWSRRIDRRIRTVGHELVHVRQRARSEPIRNGATREFLAIHWTITAEIEGVRALGRRQTLQYITQARSGALAQWSRMPNADKTRYEAKHQQVLRIQRRLTGEHTGFLQNESGLLDPRMINGGRGRPGRSSIYRLA